MSITLTTNFDAIQERHIDPYSRVDSDNTSKLLMALCKDKCVSCGFDLTLLEDDTSDPVDGVSDRVVVVLSPGSAIKDYIAFKFNQTIYLKLFDIGEVLTAGQYKYVVLDYKYQKIQTPPIATLKVIDSNNFDSSRHLALYKIIFNYDAGSQPIDLTKIEVKDLRFYNSSEPYKFRTNVYVGTANAGYITLSDAFPLEFMQIVDIDLGDYRVYPEDYISEDGVVTIAVNAPFVGDHMVLTALDFATERYETDQFCICTDPFTKTISHNLGNTYNIVGQFVWDDTIEKWSMALPGQIHFMDENTLQISNTGISGIFSKIKVYKPDYTQNATPTSVSPTITVTHDLLQKYPIVEVVDLTTNDIIIPQDIRYIDYNKLEVIFGPGAFGKSMKIMVKKGNEYYFQPTDNHTFRIYHMLDYKYLDFVQCISVATDYQEQLEWVRFDDDDYCTLKFGDAAEGWYYLSMGIYNTTKGCT